MQALAWRALESWDLRVDTMTLASSGENTVFVLGTATGPSHVLRIHRFGYHSLAELESEVRWMTALGEAGIPVPPPIRTRAGRSHATVACDDPHGYRHVGVMGWLPGTVLGDVIESARDDAAVFACFRRLGQVIARMHDQAVHWRVPASFTRPSLDAEALMGEAPHWGPFWTAPMLTRAQRALFDRVRAALRSELEQLDRTPRNWSLIHADLHAWNVLVDGQRASVIDFDDAAFGWHAFDLAVALYPWVDDPRFEHMRDELLSGYRGQRALSGTMESEVAMFLVVRSLMVIGWMWARPEIQPERRLPARITLAVRLAERWLG